MNRALGILALLAGTGGLFGAWYRLEGFVPWQAAWWRWLAQYWLWYGHPPVPIALSAGVAFTVMLLAGAWLQYRAWRLGATTLFGAVDAETLHGSARWADKRDLKTSGLLEAEGVTVGGWGGKVLRHNGPEHVLCFAPPRSGKGIGLVLPTLLEWTHSCVVFDIKGENFALTSGWRASVGQRVLRFDPAGRGGARFNPLEEVRKGTDHELMDCQNIAEMIVDPDGNAGSGKDSFFTNSGKEWLTAAMLHVIYRVEQEEGRPASLADVNFILCGGHLAGMDGHEDDGSVIEAVLKEMLTWDHGRAPVDAEVRRCAGDMRGRAPEERSGVQSTARVQLALYADPIVAANTARSDFTIHELMNGDAPLSLYVVIPPPDIDRLRPLIRILFNVMLKKLTASMAFDGGRSVAGYRHRLLLLMDEFTSIGKLEIFQKGMAYMTGYGLKAYLIVQDLTQLQQAYGKDESVTSSCHIRIAYAPNKVETARTLSDMAGKTTIVQKKRSRSGGGSKGGGSMSDSLSETARPLITPDECMQLPGAQKNRNGDVVKPGAMLIFPAGQPPIHGRQRLYFMEPELLRRARMPAAAHRTQDKTQEGGRPRAGEARAATADAPNAGGSGARKTYAEMLETGDAA